MTTTPICAVIIHHCSLFKEIINKIKKCWDTKLITCTYELYSPVNQSWSIKILVNDAMNIKNCENVISYNFNEEPLVTDDTPQTSVQQPSLLINFSELLFYNKVAIVNNPSKNFIEARSQYIMHADLTFLLDYPGKERHN